jgi:membrane protease YdiL (CAAX protease family)
VREQGRSEAEGRQFFLWALVAGLVPVCGLPVAWGLAVLGRRREAGSSYQRWYRRLVALAVLDTLVAVAFLHVSVMAWRKADVPERPSSPPVESSAPAPPARGLFEPQKPEAPTIVRDGRKSGLGLALAMGALLALWGLGWRRGADARPLHVLGVLVAAGLGAVVTARGLSALLGGPSRGGVLLSTWAQGLILVGVGAALVRSGARGSEAPEAHPWLRIYLASLGLLITLGVRTLMLMVWVSQLLEVLPDESQHPMTQLARGGPLGVAGWVLLAVPAVLLAPVGEELLFRGVLLPWLSGWMGRVASLTVSAGVFALLHLFYGLFTGWIFFLGLLLGWARLASGGLRAPILLHMTINGTALLMLARSLSG